MPGSADAKLHQEHQRSRENPAWTAADTVWVMRAGFPTCRLARSEGVIKRKDDELLDQKEQLSRLRGDFDELRGQYAALTAQGHGREQQRELSVSGPVSWGKTGKCWTAVLICA
jgi:hypothetical protein